jgi:hypothetical protein
MRKSFVIAVLAFVAGAASTWAMGTGGTNARYTLSSAGEHGINVLDLTMKAGMMPSQSYDAH